MNANSWPQKPFHRIQPSLFEQEGVVLQLRPQPLLEAVHLPLERQLPPKRLLGARLRSHFQHRYFFNFFILENFKSVCSLQFSEDIMQ